MAEQEWPKLPATREPLPALPERAKRSASIWILPPGRSAAFPGRVITHIFAGGFLTETNVNLHRSHGCGHRSGGSKPRRGGLFIATDAPRDRSFCFSAARHPDHFCAQDLSGRWQFGGISLGNAAPPKNKKEGYNLRFTL